VIDVASSTARDFSLEWIAVRVTTGGAPPPPVDTTPPAVSLTAPAAGATIAGAVTVSAAATDDVGVTRVEFLVDGVLASTDTTAPYSASWNTLPAANGAHTLIARAFDAAGNLAQSTAIGVTVNNGSPPVLSLALSGVPASLARGQTFTARGTATNSGSSDASGCTVSIAFTAADSMRLESPTGSSQALATVAPGGSQSDSWLVRADRAGSATVTMTLKSASGATLATASQTLTINN